LSTRHAMSTSGYRAAHTAPETSPREHVSGPRRAVPSAYSPANEPVASASGWNDADSHVGRGKGGMQPTQIRVGIAIASCLLVLLISWVTIGASGIGLTARQPAPPPAALKATALPTATPQPPPTATTTPKPTATTDPQIQLNTLAASYFRAVTLGTFSDASCAQGHRRHNLKARPL